MELSIPGCIFLLATVQFLLANDNVEFGYTKFIAQHRRNNKMKLRFPHPLSFSKTPTETPPAVSSPLSFCGSDVYSQIRNYTVADRMRFCCKYVDNCDDFIQPNQTKYGLENRHQLKIVTCQCDSLFDNCLDRALRSFKDPIFGAVQKYYFIDNTRKCLQKLYSPMCNGPWFDNNENEYDMNLDFYYFCPKLIQSVRRP